MKIIKYQKFGVLTYKCQNVKQTKSWRLNFNIMKMSWNQKQYEKCQNIENWERKNVQLSKCWIPKRQILKWQKFKILKNKCQNVKQKENHED